MSSSQSINPMAWVTISCNGAFFFLPGMDNSPLCDGKFAAGKPECAGTLRKVFFLAAIALEFVGELTEGGVFGVVPRRFGVAENFQQLPVNDSFHLFEILMIDNMG